MLITKVEIWNIKNHAEYSQEFDAGVTAICGPNGSGKTTIIEAIAWALFDHLDYNRDDFVKRGAKRGRVAITVRSNLDDRQYTVERDTGGGYSVFDVDTKNRLVEQKKDVVSWLKQHLGVDPQTELPVLFKSTVGVPQGTFTADFLQSPALRKKVFDQILKVEEYRQASDNLRETQKHLDSRLNEIDKKLAEAEGELKSYEEIKQHYDEVSARLHTLEIEQAEVQREREKAEAQVRYLADLLTQLNQQKGLVERAQIKLDLTRGNLSSARESAEQARLASDIVTKSRTGYEQYQTALQSLVEFEKQRAVRETLRTQARKTEHELISIKANIANTDERLHEVSQAKAEITGLAERIAEQETLEKRLAELRENRGEVQGLQHASAALDRELEKLRLRYAELAQQIKDSDKHRQLAEVADELEIEWRALNERITQHGLALQKVQFKREQLTQAKSELTRLQTDQTKFSQEIARLQPLAQQASALAASETRQHSETTNLAKLRAELARDAEMITALESGGVCPLLTEKCLNLKPGEALDKRFKSSLEMRRKEIARLEKSTVALTAELKKLRTAEAEITRLPKLQEELTKLTAAAQQQQILVTKLTAESAQTNVVSDAEIKQLQQQRQELETQLRQARAAQTKFSQGEVLRREIEGIKAEGETKRNEREALNQKLGALGEVANQLTEAETRLHEINDPRGRAAALKQIIKREGEWQKAQEKFAAQGQDISAQHDKINLALNAFATLDVSFAAASVARSTNEQAYQAFIVNEKTAATAQTRTAEAKSLAEELARAESNPNAVTAQLVALEEKYDPAEHQQSLQVFQQLRERATQIATQLTHTREQHEKLSSQVTYLNEVREKRKADLAVSEKLSTLRETTDFIRETLQKAAPYITEAYLHSISIEANQLFRDISGRFDCTLKWSNDYEITLEEKGHQRPFANLSGGEQMAAALAVRLALLKEFSDNLSLAFFDEPTTNMDEERRRNLAQQIGRITGFRQLFVISHDDSFENFTDQVVLLGERN